jgi:hypothetical protein
MSLNACVAVRTIAGEDSRLGAGGFAHHDGSVRVVLLHGGVGAVNEGSVRIALLAFGEGSRQPLPLGMAGVG